MKDVGLMAYKNGDIICAKRFSVLLQTIFQSPEFDFWMYWFHLMPPFILKTESGKSMDSRGKDSSYSTSHKQFFSRKGSLPSDLFCTNVLRWTFYRTILHQNFTGEQAVRMKRFLTNLKLHWFSTRYGEGLDKGFFMSYICKWKT